MNKYIKFCKILLENLSDLDLANKQDPSQEHSTILHKLADHPDINVKKAVAANPVTSTKTLNRILGMDPGKQENFKLAYDDDGNPEQSAEDPDYEVKKAALQNFNVDPSTVVTYSEHKPYMDTILNSPTLDFHGFENPNFYTDLFDANSGLVDHALNAGHNKFEKLFLQHPDLTVRNTFASHPNISSENLENLLDNNLKMEKPERQINSSVALHKNITPSAAEKLYNIDEEPTHYFETYRGLLAKNPSTPEHILTNIYKNNWDENTARALAENPAAAHLHSDLAEYEDPSKNPIFADELLSHSNLDPEVLDKLAMTSNHVTLRKILKHPNLSLNTRKEILNQYPDINSRRIVRRGK